MITGTIRSRVRAWAVVLLGSLAVGTTTARAQTDAPSDPAVRGGVDRVPGDYATLQEAIDLGTSRQIRVASGEYAGAVVDRPVALVCTGQCMITSGVAVGSQQAGLILTGDASGARIRGFDFVDLDLGVLASCESVGSVPDGVTIAGNAFVNVAQGVTLNGLECDGGDGWEIERNRFHDLRADISDCGGGLGVYLIGVDDAKVARNVFRGAIAAPPCGPLFTTAGVYLSGTTDTRVIENDFELGDGGHPYKLDIALFPEDGANEGTVLRFNDASGSAAPFEGINFLSVDSADITARCNTGTTALEHPNSEGLSTRYTELGCRRVPAP